MNRLRYLLTRHLRRSADMRRRREARAERALFGDYADVPKWLLAYRLRGVSCPPKSQATCAN